MTFKGIYYREWDQQNKILFRVYVLVLIAVMILAAASVITGAL